MSDRTGIDAFSIGHYRIITSGSSTEGANLCKQINMNIVQIGRDATTSAITSVYLHILKDDGTVSTVTIVVDPSATFEDLQDQIDVINTTLGDLQDQIDALGITVAAHTAELADHESRIAALE